jgi:hypothetical protein
MQDNPKVFLIRTPGSLKKFKILTPETKLNLKANTQAEREEWISKIAEEVREGVGEEGAVVQNDDGGANPAEDGMISTSKKKRLLDAEAPSPTLSQINDLLLEHESRLHKKIDQSQAVYERYALDMVALEDDLEKKHRDKFSRMKASSQEFLQHQKEAMEMIAKVTRSIYQILENIAEKEIEKDPIGFMKE